MRCFWGYSIAAKQPLHLIMFIVRKSTDLRFGLDLCAEERDYVAKRKQRIFETMQDKLGEEDGPQTIEEVGDILRHFQK